MIGFFKSVVPGAVKWKKKHILVLFCEKKIQYVENRSFFMLIFGQCCWTNAFFLILRKVEVAPVKLNAVKVIFGGKSPSFFGGKKKQISNVLFKSKSLSKSFKKK